MSARRLPVIALLLVASLALAGCARPPAAEDVTPDRAPSTPTPRTTPASPTPEPRAPPSNPTPSGTPPPASPTPDPEAVPPAIPAVPRVVVALVDSGINPYHREFRDDSPEAFVHPSTYLPGYPASAKPLELTLHASTLEEALTADDAIWKSAQPGELYYVPGTRVIGLTLARQDGDRPLFDDDGHGTMTASRAAGATTSLAPSAKIVAIEGLGSAGVVWAGKQNWIDIQTNSWIDIVPLIGVDAERAAFGDAAVTQPVFAATGNGVAQQYGGVGQPSTVAATSGASGVIAVGGHDNGRYTSWAGTMPHVVADACWSWAADAKTLDKTGPRVGSGTSAAAPYVAGAAAALVLNARTILGDLNVSHEGGVLARGPSGLVADGPLADGQFTLEEFKALIFKTADPHAQATAHDGDECDVSMTPYTTLPLAAADTPPDVPTYYAVGYGIVNVNTLARAKGILEGVLKLPERANEDTIYGLESIARGLIR